MLLTIVVAAGLMALAGAFCVRAFGLDPVRRRQQALEQVLTGIDATMLVENADRPEGVQGFVLAVLADLSRSLRSSSDKTRRMLSQAGAPMSIERFRIRQLNGGAIAGGAAALVGLLMGGALIAILLGVCGGFAGCMWPRAVLKSKVRRRQEQVWLSLAEIINFLAICHAAGQPIEVAVETVTRTASGPVVETLRRVLRRFRMGWPLDRAFDEAAEGETLSQARDFYGVLAEGVRNSGNLNEILAAQTETLRMAQKVNLEDALARRESRMLWPFIGFVLPPIAAIAAFVMFGAMKSIF